MQKDNMKKQNNNVRNKVKSTFLTEIQTQANKKIATWAISGLIFVFLVSAAGW